MALKTIHLHAGKAVTALAEVVGVGVARMRTVAAWLHVAIDAVYKAVLLGADAFVHGAVALMKDEFHVTAAHDLGRLDALITFSGGNGRQQLVVGLHLHDEKHRQSGEG